MFHASVSLSRGLLSYQRLCIVGTTYAVPGEGKSRGSHCAVCAVPCSGRHLRACPPVHRRALPLRVCWGRPRLVRAPLPALHRGREAVGRLSIPCCPRQPADEFELVCLSVARDHLAARARRLCSPPIAPCRNRDALDHDALLALSARLVPREIEACSSAANRRLLTRALVRAAHHRVVAALVLSVSTTRRTLVSV